MYDAYKLEIKLITEICNNKCYSYFLMGHPELYLVAYHV